MLLPDGTAKEFINWLKTEGFGFSVIAIVDNLGNMDAIDVVLTLDNQLLPRKSDAWLSIVTTL